MKKISYLKQALLQLTIVATIFLFAACSSTDKPEDTKDVAEELNESKFDDNKQEKDAQFLVNAAEINLEEIQLGQLAQQKGTADEVKSLGKMMEEAHTKSLNDLTALAKTKTITIPTAATDNALKAYNSMNEKTGNDFDKEYADKMVSGHKDAISAFEKASTDGTDTDIRNWATASLPDLRTHLDHSIDCQKKVADMYLNKKK